MKKFLLSFTLCLVAIAAMAQKQYTEKIAVTLNGMPFPDATSTLSLTKNDNGTCDFILPNFLLPSPEPGAAPMYVGTIDLKGVTPKRVKRLTKSASTPTSKFSPATWTV